MKGRVLKENSKMKSKERKLMLMECINENLNSVIKPGKNLLSTGRDDEENGQAGERSERYYKN